MTGSTDVWDRCLEALQKDLNRQSFETWFKPTRGALVDEKTLQVFVPNEFFRDWIRDHYSADILKAVHEAHPEQLEIRFEVEPRSLKAPASDVTTASGNDPAAGYASTVPSEGRKPIPAQVELSFVEKPSPARLSKAHEFVLNPKFAFDNFVVGNSNRFAHAASLAVAESPGKSYNPLFIYGGVGLGKTHLLQAIGNYARQQNPNIKILYISSERFLNDFIESIQSGKSLDFRNKYRTVDLLLIDDIQFWEGKESTQEEFFHTFNVLYEAGKQIVATSDTHPKEIPLEERLKNRFQMGLTTDIQEPDVETRVAILRKKAAGAGVSVPAEVMTYIAHHVKSNIRELEGSMLRVLAFASLTKQEITLDAVKEVLKDSLPSDDRRVSIETIQRVVAERYNCKFFDMRSKKRTKLVAFPRQVAMYLSRELTPHSLSEIGAAFGGKDHTTIIHAYDKIEDLCSSDPTLASEIQSLRKTLTDGSAGA
jgi:chromosomal replication initiator protein